MKTQDILQTLQSQPMTLDDIAEAIGLPVGQVVHTLKKLRTDGYLAPLPRRYEITAQGAALLAKHLSTQEERKAARAEQQRKWAEELHTVPRRRGRPPHPRAIDTSRPAANEVGLVRDALNSRPELQTVWGRAAA